MNGVSRRKGAIKKLNKKTLICALIFVIYLKCGSIPEVNSVQYLKIACGWSPIQQQKYIVETFYRISKYLMHEGEFSIKFSIACCL